MIYDSPQGNGEEEDDISNLFKFKEVPISFFFSFYLIVGEQDNGVKGLAALLQGPLQRRGAVGGVQDGLGHAGQRLQQVLWPGLCCHGGENKNKNKLLK